MNNKIKILAVVFVLALASLACGLGSGDAPETIFVEGAPTALATPVGGQIFADGQPTAEIQAVDPLSAEEMYVQAVLTSAPFANFTIERIFPATAAAQDVVLVVQGYPEGYTNFAMCALGLGKFGIVTEASNYLLNQNPGVIESMQNEATPNVLYCEWVYAPGEGYGGGALETAEATPTAAAPVAEADTYPLWEGYNLTGLGSFVPHSNTFTVVETIYEEAAWSQPDFVPPWPPHSPDPARQDCPKVDGQKVWCSVMIRPGDVVIWNSDAISTPMGSYLNPSGGWFTNNTTHQIEVSFMFGELVVIEPGEGQTSVDADQMARVLLKLVVSTNGLTSAAYLGEIPIH